VTDDAIDMTGAREWLIRASELQRQLDRFLAHLAVAKRSLIITGDAQWQPSVDVYEAGDRVVVIADVAGVEPSQVAIDVEGQTLVIKGIRQLRAQPVEAKCHQIEIGLGAFERAVSLRAEVNPDRVEVRFNDGLLEVTLPKVTKPSRIVGKVKTPLRRRR